MHDTESIMHLFYLLFLIVLSLCWRRCVWQPDAEAPVYVWQLC